MKKYILLLITIFLFTSCSNKIASIDKQTNFAKITKQLVKPICKYIYPEQVLYITDFVNETNLQNNSKLGFVLSNSLKANILNNNCTKSTVIKSFELANNLKIGSEGSRIFTRKLEEVAIKDINYNNQILVGTYILTSKQMILYLKLINLNSKNIISSYTKSVPITDEILDLEGIQTTKEKKEQNVNNIYRPFHL